MMPAAGAKKYTLEELQNGYLLHYARRRRKFFGAFWRRFCTKNTFLSAFWARFSRKNAPEILKIFRLRRAKSRTGRVTEL